MKMILAIDFDGTIVDHRYPRVGDEVPGAFRWLKRFQELGAFLILYTMRSDGRDDGNDLNDGNYLKDAVDFCKSKGVEFWAHNHNPEQYMWTGSPKVYAHAYIDDAAVGCPLRSNPRSDGSPYVDWDAVGPQVEQMILARKKALGESAD